QNVGREIVVAWDLAHAGAFRCRGRHASLRRAHLCFLPIERHYAECAERPQRSEIYCMILSRDRILTTHVGSLPRNEKLSDLLVKREAGEPYDTAEMEREMDRAVSHVVEKQISAGIDIGNDGEQQRVGFQTYVPQRMSGFGGVSKRRRGREFEEFPELIEQLK